MRNLRQLESRIVALELRLKIVDDPTIERRRYRKLLRESKRLRQLAIRLQHEPDGLVEILAGFLHGAALGIGAWKLLNGADPPVGDLLEYPCKRRSRVEQSRLAAA